MGTGPMPRKPNATKPKAKTAGASMMASKPCVLIQAPVAINASIAMPSQNALKLPATRPDKMLSDAPPSSDEVTTSRTCRECTDVKAFTSSGIIAPARVPQVITEESFHHSVVSPPRFGIIWLDTRYVAPIEMAEVNHTREVSGASKFIFATLPYLLLATASLMKYETAEETTIITRITKIHTN